MSRTENPERRETLFSFTPRKRPKPGNERSSDRNDRANVNDAHAHHPQSHKDSSSRLSSSSSYSIRESTSGPTTNGFAEVYKLHFPQIVDPWTKFEPLLRVLQGNPSILAHSIPPRQILYAVRIVASTERDNHLHAIQQLGLYTERGVDQVEEIFDWDGKLSIVTEYTRPSLSQIITSEIRPKEAHIAFLAHEILVTLELLEEQGLIHGSLTSSFVLIPVSCMPILAHPPCWRPASQSERHTDTAALANLIIRLMDKSAITFSETELRVKEPQKWSKTMLDFIDCARQQTASVLRAHSFLNLRCQPLEICGLRSVADHTTWCHWEFLKDQNDDK